MKKILLVLMVGAMMMTFCSSGWSLAPLHAVDTVLRGVDGTDISTFGGTTVTIQVVLVSPTTRTGGRSQWCAVDTTTGYGILLDRAGTGLEAALPVGLKNGMYVQIECNIVSFGAADIGGSSLIEASVTGDSSFVVLGTVATPTTVVPSLASITAMDPTFQSGGLIYESRLCRINNVHAITTPALGNNANMNITDATGAVTTNIFFGAAALGYLNAIYPNFATGTGPGTYNLATTSNFDIIATEERFSTYPSNPYGYEFRIRGFATDFIPHFGVLPTGPVTTQPTFPTQLTVFGGFPPYTWSLNTTLAGQGTLNTTSGATVIYTAGATVGSLQAIAKDSAGESIPISISVIGASAPMAPDISMDSMKSSKEVVKSAIKPSSHKF